MSAIDHHHWAKRILGLLIQHVGSFRGGVKYLTYGEVAIRVGYPEPYTGNLFGKNIGATLGVMGHLFDSIIIRGETVPMIQTLVVSKSAKLPSEGLKEFKPTYPNLSTEKKRDFAKNEYQKIDHFGDSWVLLAEQLGIEMDGSLANTSVTVGGRRNTYGSEGSPEHRTLRNYIANNPEAIGLPHGVDGITEYPLKSGDSIDVVFEYEDRVAAVEVKSLRSGDDDIERGLYQCIKYAAVLEAEEITSSSARAIDCSLVLEGDLPKTRVKDQTSLGVTVYSNISPGGLSELA